MLDRIGTHAAQCPSCYTRLTRFFKTVELPESGFIKETLDELALSLYNLGRAIIRDRPPEEEDQAAVLHITEEGGGSAQENVASGVEMIEDAEDYAGSTMVHGVDLEALRDLLDDAETAQGMREELARRVFGRITEMECRYVGKAWNWIGALHYGAEQFDDAEVAFKQVLALGDAAREVRAFAHCSLSYIQKHRGDLDAAIKSARRSAVLAEEDGEDPYFGRFAEVYLRLLRGQEGDEAAAAGELDRILALADGAERFHRDLHAAQNAPVLKAFRASSLAGRYPFGEPAA